MNSLICQLLHIQEEFISDLPKVLFGLDCCGDGIKDFPGGLLVLWGDGAGLSEGLYCLSIFTLKHHLAVSSPVGRCPMLEGFQVVDGMSVKASSHWTDWAWRRI